MPNITENTSEVALVPGRGGRSPEWPGEVCRGGLEGVAMLGAGFAERL